MKVLKLTVHGKVQGVGYRRWFEKTAVELGLKGYVKNLATGEVEAVIVGNEQDILKMIQQSYIGPRISNVESITQTELELDQHYLDFKMLR